MNNHVNGKDQFYYTIQIMRMMKYADHHGFPIITFIDTPGAFADLKSKELNWSGGFSSSLLQLMAS